MPAVVQRLGNTRSTKLISTVVKNQYGFEAPDLEELVTWADIVDGALEDGSPGYEADLGDRGRV
jgi:hypothetical protein